MLSIVLFLNLSPMQLNVHFLKLAEQNKMLEASPEGLTVSHHRYQPQDTQKDNQNYKTACLINALTLVHDLLMHF